MKRRQSSICAPHKRGPRATAKTGHQPRTQAHTAARKARRGTHPAPFEHTYGGRATMPWETSHRREQLPPNWNTLRDACRTRAGNQCQALMRDQTRCPEQGTDCDHITPGMDHTPGNLQWLCAWHHKQKTQAEATAARLLRPRRTTARPKEKHPGLT